MSRNELKIFKECLITHLYKGLFEKAHHLLRHLFFLCQSQEVVFAFVLIVEVTVKNLYPIPLVLKKCFISHKGSAEGWDCSASALESEGCEIFLFY